MTTAQLRGLFAGLLADAALFPPAFLDVRHAVRAHAGHRLSWYADLLGPFVCHGSRLRLLDAEVARLALAPVDVAVVVSDGIEAVAASMQVLDSCERLRLRSVETPLGAARLADASRVLGPLAEHKVDAYVEIPVTRVSERDVHQMRAAGLRLKLRTGGTTIDVFHTEEQLAVPIVMCAAELLPFKCSAGLHNAVRHRDADTLFEHHGFLNIALAARAAAATGSLAATSAALAQRAPDAVATQVGALNASAAAAIRELFASFGTCSIAEPVGDLTAMGLVSAP
jgi:hypothetical protein